MARGVTTAFWVLAAILLSTRAGRAQTHDTPAEPSTAPATRQATPPGRPPATLELTLPAGGTVTVDDKDAGDARRLSFDDVPADGRRVKVVVKLPDGPEEQRLVDLESGRGVSLVVNRPPAGKPAAVALQGLPSVTSVAVSPDGRWAAAASEGKGVVLWDLAAGRPLRAITGHTDTVSAVRFTPDGRGVLTGSADATAVLWDADTGTPRQTFRGHAGGVMAVAVSPDGRWVATGSADKTAVVWDARTGRPVSDFKGHKLEVAAVAFGPDGATVASGSYDGTLAIWEAASGKQLFFAKAHNDCVSSVAFTPDGTKLIAGSFDNSASIWDVAAGKKVRSTGKHPIDVLDVAPAPGGRGVLTASRDFTVALWDATSGQKIRSFAGHTNEVNALAVTPDGRLMLTGARDGTLRLWELATGVELACLAADPTARAWAVIAPDGLFDASDDGRRMTGFIFAGGQPAAAADQVFGAFFHPGLLARVYRGERPYATAQLGRGLPPAVKITSPRSRTAETQEVTVTVEAVDGGGGVSGLALYDNNARVAAQGGPARDGKAVRQSFRLSPGRGLNRLRATAANGDGSWEGAAEFELTYAGPADRKARMYVVAVGVGGPAAADAAALAAALRRRAGSLYDRVDVVPLLDREATGEMIEDTLADVAALAKPQDVLMLLLHGRGALAGGGLYFAPGDLPGDRGRSAESLAASGLSVSRLGEIMSASPALRRAMVVDLAAPPDPAGAPPAGAEFGLRGAAERLSRSWGVYAVASVAPGRSLLGGALLAALDGDAAGPLEGKAPDPAGTADVLEWFDAAAAQTRAAAARLGVPPPDVQATTQSAGFPVARLAK